MKKKVLTVLAFAAVVFTTAAGQYFVVAEASANDIAEEETSHTEKSGNTEENSRSEESESVEMDWTFTSAQLKTAAQGEEYANVEVWTGKVFSIPLSVLQEMAGKKVTLAARTGYSLTFSITGTDIGIPEEGIKMTLSSCGTIPGDVKMKLLSRAQVSYEFSMEEKDVYPCPVNVHMNFGAENAGKTAVLCYYDETAGIMRFAGAFRVTEKGDAMFGITRGDEYIAVIAEGNTYRVSPGDTLSGIASQKGMTLRSLLLANPQIKDADRIHPGQILVIL